MKFRIRAAGGEKPRIKMLAGVWFCRSSRGSPLCFGLARSPQFAYVLWALAWNREVAAA
jgi:hypothetical protein